MLLIAKRYIFFHRRIHIQWYTCTHTQPKYQYITKNHPISHIHKEIPQSYQFDDRITKFSSQGWARLRHNILPMGLSQPITKILIYWRHEICLYIMLYPLYNEKDQHYWCLDSSYSLCTCMFLRLYSFCNSLNKIWLIDWLIDSLYLFLLDIIKNAC